MRAGHIVAWTVLCLGLIPSNFATEADRYLKRPPEWFETAEAQEIGRNLLTWQTPNGDWPKNTDTVTQPRRATEANLKGTFDNGATTGELRLLARIYHATQRKDFRDAFDRGLGLILRAQYPVGGWPQSFPPGNGYWRYITYNDDTFVHLADLVHDVATQEQFAFVGEEVRQQCARAYRSAIDCVLRTQIKVAGELTAWCAQHDPVTLEPRPARSFELVSLSGAESARLLLFLMRVDKPNPKVRAAIQAGVQWFDQVKLTGIRLVRENGDRKVIFDATAPPLWARFYEIGSNRPFFSGRDGIKRYNISEIEPERRNGYAWYGNWGAPLPEAYAKWQRRWPEAHAQASLEQSGKRSAPVHDPTR